MIYDMIYDIYSIVYYIKLILILYYIIYPIRLYYIYYIILYYILYIIYALCCLDSQQVESAGTPDHNAQAHRHLRPPGRATITSRRSPFRG